jgi:hypothetical protein
MKKTKYSNIVKLVAVSAISSVLLTGCGGGSDSGNNASPTVEYGGDVSGDNSLAKYTSADWLYQNYFGEYGLPDELKTMMMPELKMMANGFALQHSRGEDVEASISQLNTAMQMMYYSGQFGSSIQQMLVESDSGVYSTPDNTISHDTSTDEERTISVQAQENISEASRLDEEYIWEQEQLVAEHNLPYLLPDRITKYVTYNQSMKGGGGKNSNNNNNNNSGAGNNHNGIDGWNWWEADFTWTNGAAGIGHMGLVTNVSFSIKDIIDSNTGPGVKRHFGLNNWANTGGWSRVEGWYYTSWGSSDYRRGRAVSYANSLVGTPYNWVFWNKNANNKTYCSQLIWQAFERQGVNLDNDGGLIVWPNDIRNHVSTSRFNSSSI